MGHDDQADHVEEIDVDVIEDDEIPDEGELDPDDTYVEGTT